MLMYLTQNMNHLLAAFLSFVIAQIVIKGFRNYANTVGFVDRPDRSRKLQAIPVPLGGGVAVWMAAWAAWGLIILLLPSISAPGSDQYVYLGLALGSLAILILGIADDLFGLRGAHKLVGQVIASSIPVALGLRIESVGLLGFQIEMGALAAPAAIFWIVLVVNAFNLIDGMDGFCGSLALIACTTLSFLAYQNGSHTEGLLEVAIVGALVGFLADNLPPARIYMGDAGSMMIGLVVAVLSLRACGAGLHSRLSLLPLLSLSSLPLLDVVAAIGRRWLTGRSLFSPDRGHLHHRLIERFGSNGRALAIAIGLSSLAASGAGLALHGGYGDLSSALFLALVLLILVGSGIFGVSELRLVWARVKVKIRSLRFSHPNNEREAGFNCHLQGSRDWTAPWQAAVKELSQAGAKRVELTINIPRAGEVFHALWTLAEGARHGRNWQVSHDILADHICIGILRVSGRDNAVSLKHLAQVHETIIKLEEGLSEIICFETQHCSDLSGEHLISLGLDSAVGETDTPQQVSLSPIVTHSIPMESSLFEPLESTDSTSARDHALPGDGIRVLHLGKFYPPALGGIETAVHSLAHAQSALGCSVRVICMDHAEGRPTANEKDGPIDVVRLRRIKSFAKLDLMTDLPQTLFDSEADLIHLHTPNPSMILGMTLSQDNRPLVITHHSDVVKQRVRKILFSPLEKICYDRAQLILASSPGYIEGSDLLKARKSKVEVLPFGLDLDPFLEPQSVVVDEALRIKQKYPGPIWFCLGRLVYYKGFATAIQALQYVPGTLLLAGSGPEMPKLIQLAEKLRLSHRICFLGNLPTRDDVISHLKAANAFWFPSNERSEAFGLVQVEAMACGCPVINTNILGSGVPWVSRNDESGLTVPVNDPMALATAAKRILDEPGLASRLAAGGRERAIRDFSMEAMGMLSLNYYNRILGRPLLNVNNSMLGNLPVVIS